MRERVPVRRGDFYERLRVSLLQYSLGRELKGLVLPSTEPNSGNHFDDTIVVTTSTTTLEDHQNAITTSNP